MSHQSGAISKFPNEHQAALRWFETHRGQTVSWTTLQDHATTGPRLVTQAKGIYKPAGSDYALSVRQTLDSPYADKEVVRRPDGSWVYPYFQENSDPAQRDKEATNRGLMRCLADGVPVGVLIQTKPKPGVEYLVLGLAAVTEWKDGYFILEGFSDNGELRAAMVGSDAAHDRARATASPPEPDFELGNGADARERQIAEVVRRRGQARFRAALIGAYGGKCAITGCDAVEALEAAHISPYRGVHTDYVQNGLLLRADIHSLFDLGLIAVDPATLRVVISPQLRPTTYGALQGAQVTRPAAAAHLPSREALAQHLAWTGLDVTGPTYAR